MNLSAKQFKLAKEMKLIATAVFSVVMTIFLLPMGYLNNKLNL